MKLFTSLQQKKLFLRNKTAFSKKCTVKEAILCTIFFLRLCDCFKKMFKNSSREVYFLVRAKFTGL